MHLALILENENSNNNNNKKKKWKDESVFFCAYIPYFKSRRSI